MPPVNKLTQPDGFSWLIHHAVLLLLVVGLGVGLFYFVENVIQKHDLAQEEKYNSLLANQSQQTASLQKQLTTDESNWAAIQKQLLQQNSALEQKILTQNQVTQKQVQNDQTLDAQQSADRLAQQTNAKQGEVVAQGNNLLLDLPITRVVTSDIDMLDGARVALSGTQTELKNETTINTNLQTQTQQQTTVIAGLQAQNVEQMKACAAEVGALKAQNRKSKIKIFFKGVGIGAGIVLTAILGHKL